MMQSGMEIRMKRKSIILAALAVAFAMCVCVSPALAYFTDHHTTDGGLTIMTKPTTEMEEWVGQGKKEIAIKNTGEVEVFVRAGVYASSAIPVKSISGSDWSAAADGTWDAGWYYYEKPLAPGDSTPRLTAEIKLETNDKSVLGENYNIIVVYEYSAVQYDENGNPSAVEWSHSYPAAS